MAFLSNFLISNHEIRGYAFLILCLCAAYVLADLVDQLLFISKSNKK